jgi:hypothetical protein
VQAAGQEGGEYVSFGAALQLVSGRREPPVVLGILDRGLDCDALDEELSHAAGRGRQRREGSDTNSLCRWPVTTGQDSTSRRITPAVAPSAGKRDSIASSDNVMSTGVPKTVVVLTNDSTPDSLASRSGTATPA